MTAAALDTHLVPKDNWLLAAKADTLHCTSNGWRGSMRKEFIHPLARAARVWLAEGPDGSDQRVLVVVTTMELDPKSDRFKEKLVERLSHAAKEHLAQSCDADAFIIMNPLRDWRTRIVHADGLRLRHEVR